MLILYVPKFLFEMICLQKCAFVAHPYLTALRSSCVVGPLINWDLFCRFLISCMLVLGL